MSSTVFSHGSPCLGTVSQAAVGQTTVLTAVGSTLPPQHPHRAASLFVKNGLALDKNQQGDPFYRYQIPKLSVSYVGPHSGTTQLNNLPEIAAALQRPISVLLQHFSIELSVHAAHHVNNTDSRYHLRGRHDMQRLIDGLYIFIDRFVICRRCKDPTSLTFVRPTTTGATGKARLLMTCPSCGHVLDLLDGKANQWASEKIVNFMVHAYANSDSPPPTPTPGSAPELNEVDGLPVGTVGKEEKAAPPSKSKGKSKQNQGERITEPQDAKTTLTLLSEPLKQNTDSDLLRFISVLSAKDAEDLEQLRAQLEAAHLKTARRGDADPLDSKEFELLGATMVEAVFCHCIVSVEPLIEPGLPASEINCRFQKHAEALLAEGCVNHSMLMRLFGSESVETLNSDEVKLQKREKDAADKATKKRKDDLDAFFCSAALDGEPAPLKVKKAAKEKVKINVTDSSPSMMSDVCVTTGGGERSDMSHRAMDLPPAPTGSKERHQLRVGCLNSFLTRLRLRYAHNWTDLSTFLGELIERFFSILFQARLILPRDVRALNLAGLSLGSELDQAASRLK